MDQNTLAQIVAVAALIEAFPECGDDAVAKLKDFVDKHMDFVARIDAVIESAEEENVKRGITAVINAVMSVLVEKLEAEAA